MEGIIEKRKKAGKLLVLKLVYEFGEIQAIHLEGDFFLHPEDSLPQIEEILRTSKKLKEELTQYVTEKGIVLVGFTVDDVVELVESAKEEME